MSCDSQCSYVLPDGAVGWSAKYDCGIIFNCFLIISYFVFDLILYVPVNNLSVMSGRVFVC